jgi:glutathione synthase/RimK-type ligase-like ATP-grasp enzyme
MIVGIHQNSPDGLDKDTEIYETILDYNGIDTVRLDINDSNFWEEVKKLDLFIYRWHQIDDHRQIAHSIMPVVEKKLGVKCFPDTTTCWHYDDKVRQYYLLRGHNFSITESYIFYDKIKALRWIENTRLPVVFKLKNGAGSENVILIESVARGKRVIRRMFGRGIVPTFSGFGDVHGRLRKGYLNVRHFIGQKIKGRPTSDFWQVQKDYVLFQKYLKNNDYDTRVTVIGHRAFAFRRLNRPNDFRSSGSGRIDYCLDKIDLRFVTKALEISRTMGFQSMAYDSLYDENGDVSFCEISYAYEAPVVYHCAGYWDEELRWHEGHYWPQYFQLMDALGIPDLKQPEMGP